jgi:hypothetical protein
VTVCGLFCNGFLRPADGSNTRKDEA